MANSAEGTERVRIPTLDGWRAVAVAMVTVCHLAQVFWMGVRPDLVQRFAAGAFGVDIFFGISGLLITTLLLREWEANGRISLRAFYVRRTFRIIIPCLLYIGFLCATGMIYSRQELFGSLFFYRNYLHEDLFAPHTPHLWSLSVEEHFYLLWPLVLVLVTPRHGQITATWGAILITLWRVAGMANFPELSHAFPHYRSDYRMDSLLWGCAMAFLIRDPKSRTLLETRFRPIQWLGLVVALFASLDYMGLPLVRAWVPILVAFILVGTVLHPHWLVGRFLELPALRWVGKLSYGFYLWQLAFLMPMSEPNRAWWQTFPQNVFLTLGVAIASYYLIEVRLIRIGHRLSAQLTPKPAAPPEVRYATAAAGRG